MTIIYLISKLLTFPGAYLKGFWEHVTCRILKIPVESTKYLQLNELCGHVSHPFAKTKAKSFMVCFLPGILNALFAVAMFCTGFINLCLLDVGTKDYATGTSIIFIPVYIIMLYIGASFMCNIYPLYDDAIHMWDMLYNKESDVNIIAKILLFIPSAIIVVGSFFERFGLTTLATIVAIAVGIIL